MKFSYILDSLEVFDLRRTEIDLSTIGNRRFMYHPNKFGFAPKGHFRCFTPGVLPRMLRILRACSGRRTVWHGERCAVWLTM